MIKKANFAVAALVAAVSFLPAGAFAGPDLGQQQLQHELGVAKAKQEQAEKAKSTERQKLMQEHMQMMQQAMDQMQAMKPHAGMTMEEHEEWIAEHQKLMDEILQQMMTDHHMMMQHGK
jgi:uncharacterized protein HemX